MRFAALIAVWLLVLILVLATIPALWFFVPVVAWYLFVMVPKWRVQRQMRRELRLVLNG